MSDPVGSAVTYLVSKKPVLYKSYPWRINAPGIHFPITSAGEEELYSILEGYDEIHVVLHYSLAYSEYRGVSFEEYHPFSEGDHIVLGRRGGEWEYVYYVSFGGSWGRYMASLLRGLLARGTVDVLFTVVLLGSYDAGRGVFTAVSAASAVAADGLGEVLAGLGLPSRPTVDMIVGAHSGGRVVGEGAGGVAPLARKAGPGEVIRDAGAVRMYAPVVNGKRIVFEPTPWTTRVGVLGDGRLRRTAPWEQSAEPAETAYAAAYMADVIGYKLRPVFGPGLLTLFPDLVSEIE